MSTLYIVWGDNNELGIPIIDEQHRGVTSTINSLHYFIQAGHGHEIIKPTMLMLKQYVEVHFKTEVGLMAEAGYPALEEHLGLHKGFVAKIGEFSAVAQWDEGSDRILQFLKKWWLGHINNADRKYVPFLKNKDTDAILGVDDGAL